MFRRFQAEDLPIKIFFDGRPVQCRPGDTVAAALLAAGIDRFRTTPIKEVGRMPYCMIGNCFDCIVEIDGAADRQSCLVFVADGLQVRSQHVR